ncbi:DUF736 domain-containing protein [Novosphingobium sp. Fuku2-ISO-50]|uniref:DUF736 domain-containing protein n=1 Tax=Novosphingobium sp. Fuku2-ISO-50 TaxID=1739114 RepID=UPI00076DA72C|nr:DUF736 domain-containing protein [Novosphingobium sp. Fuku2-ISO-50]KUR74200.1 hypothetical protein AQZ50_18005 [Novosphingobium sp. Fuku2-ISO-50]
MNIGTIRANDRGALTGSIATLTVAMSFALRGAASNHPNAPRYEICTRSPAGAAVQIGALWEQTSKTTGECFLQGRIDDPSMARPLAISAFRQDDGSYNVAWLRPQRRSGFRVASSANDNPTYLDAA